MAKWKQLGRRGTYRYAKRRTRSYQAFVNREADRYGRQQRAIWWLMVGALGLALAMVLALAFGD